MPSGISKKKSKTFQGWGGRRRQEKQELDGLNYGYEGGAGSTREMMVDCLLFAK